MAKTMKVTIGSDSIEWYRGSFKVPRTTSCWLCQWARFVIRTGVDPDTWVTPLRDGKKALEPRTLRWWAGKTVVENDRESARFKDYVPFRGEDQ